MKRDVSSLLIVEDNPADMALYIRLLEDVEHGFEHIECLSTIKDATKWLESTQAPTCCLLDFNLPDGSAISLLESLHSDNGLPKCPIIVITGQEDTKNAVQLLKLGAQDYLVKDDLSSHVLLRIIQNAVNNWQLSKELEKMALYDSLTGLSNRGLFLEKTEQTFNESIRYKHTFCVLLIDLDRFKSINDIYGHQAGDLVLQKVAEKMLSCTRVADVVGRLGGDEFAILLPETSDQSAHLVVKKLLKSLILEVSWNNASIPVTPSIGMAMFPSAAQDFKQLMQEADIALYKAKNLGRAQYVAYNEQTENKEDQVQILKDELPMALQRGELKIAYQAIVPAKQTGQIYAIEALTRWCFRGKWVAAVDIINWVMELGIDEKFHLWLLDDCFRTLVNFQKQHPKLKLSINLMANVCHNFSFADMLHTYINKYDVAPESIILEITELHLNPHPDKALEGLNNLAKQGFIIAIDNFGSGFCSMEYLANLPCKILKVDKKFLLELDKNERNRNIIDAIASLAHSLDILVVAEGVESENLKAASLALGCDFLQGYHIAYPTIATTNDWASFQSAIKDTPDDLKNSE